jgi:hypothetical protein
VTFDGSADESWNFATGRDYASIAVSKKGTYTTPIISNNAIGVTWSNFNNPVNLQLGTGSKPLPTYVMNGTINTFRAWLASNPITVIYILETPIIEDISSLITGDNLIGVEGGGTLTFENEYKYDVPSEIVYQVWEK